MKISKLGLVILSLLLAEASSLAASKKNVLSEFIDSEENLILPLERDFEDEEENDFYEDLEGDEEALSSVINLTATPEKPIRTFVSLAAGKDVEFEIDGKLRYDTAFSKDTSLLNNRNGTLDQTVQLRHTFDLGFGIECGKETYGKSVLGIGCDLRNKLTWGKPDEVAKTTKASIKDVDYVFGEHTHLIGIPILYVRGLDFTLDLNTLFNKNDCDTTHRFKCGLFPFTLGRGISLGAAYAVTPDFITYDPANVIQEFAPGVLFSGDLKQKVLSYKAYMGLFSNKSSSFNDVNERIRSQEYNKRFDPARGFGIFNGVFATEVTWNKEITDKCTAKLSPYLLFAHEGEEIVEVLGDASSNLITLGFAGELVGTENLSISFEVAKNIGKQEVRGIDRNVITRKYLDRTPGVGVLYNSHVEFVAPEGATALDSQGKNAVYAPLAKRQDDIFAFQSSSAFNGKTFKTSLIDLNGNPIMATLKNKDDRYRDPYCNALNGYMAVLDLVYKSCINDINYKAALAVGIASGDDNPNKSIEATDDFSIDGSYEGFIGLQEIYSGKEVRSVFLMSGVSKVPRILSVPGRSTDPKGNQISVGFPSVISRFTNLAFVGGSLTWDFDSSNFKWNINPNILAYFQPEPPRIYDAVLAKRLKTERVHPYLGSEFNLFFEANSIHIDGLKFFGTGTIFLPGTYYNDLTGLPLNKQQQDFLDALDKTGTRKETVPTLGSDLALFLTAGLEFKF